MVVGHIPQFYRTGILELKWNLDSIMSRDNDLKDDFNLPRECILHSWILDVKQPAAEGY